MRIGTKHLAFLGKMVGGTLATFSGNVAVNSAGISLDKTELTREIDGRVDTKISGTSVEGPLHGSISGKEMGLIRGEIG